MPKFLPTRTIEIILGRCLHLLLLLLLLGVCIFAHCPRIHSRGHCPRILLHRNGWLIMELHSRHHSDEQSGLIEGRSYQGGQTHHDEEAATDDAVHKNRSRPMSAEHIVRLVAALLLGVCIALYWVPHDGTSARLKPPNEQDSCADFLHEKASIMALKETSTVENMKNGAVASDHPICSQIGTIILNEHEGNAVDAAVATAFCLGVVNPASSGIGGGAFILIHSDMASHLDKIGSPEYSSPEYIDARDPDDLKLEKVHATKVTEVIDAREVAPMAATTNMYVGQAKEASEKGGLAVAVPGELRGLELAHGRHGRLPWASVVEPAMRLALEGFPVGDHLAADIGEHRGTGNVLSILTENGDMVTPLTEGDILKQPELAKTLQAIMESGADAMYKGERGEAIAKDVQNAGGILTAEDLATYRATLRSPLIAQDVGGFTLVGVPPPSSGGAALIGAARFLASLATPFASFADTLSIHNMVEALRHSFAIRMSLSDPTYYTNMTMEAVHDLVEGRYMEHLSRLTRENSTLPLSMYGGEKWAQLGDDEGRGQAVDAHEGDRRTSLRSDDANSTRRRTSRRFGYLEDHGTTHLSIIDKDRNAVTLTSSLNTYFGCGVLSESTGVLLNDQMDDFGTPGIPDYFGLTPSKSNYIKPGKKPLSSMSPLLVFRRSEGTAPSRMGHIFMALGASGGPKIISAVLQVFINYAWLGLSLFESTANARLHDQLLYHESATTLYEDFQLEQGQTIEVPLRTREALEKRGHSITSVDYIGCVQSVAVDLESDTLTATSDIRKSGVPAGY